LKPLHSGTSILSCSIQGRVTMKLQALRLSSSSSIVTLFLLSASILPIVNAFNTPDSHNTLQQITFQSETATEAEFNTSCVPTSNYPCCCNPCPAIMCPSFTPSNRPPTQLAEAHFMNPDGSKVHQECCGDNCPQSNCKAPSPYGLQPRYASRGPPREIQSC
jgi:hypothetical protein